MPSTFPFEMTVPSQSPPPTIADASAVPEVQAENNATQSPSAATDLTATSPKPKSPMPTVPNTRILRSSPPASRQVPRTNPNPPYVNPKRQKLNSDNVPRASSGVIQARVGVKPKAKTKEELAILAAKQRAYRKKRSLDAATKASPPGSRPNPPNSASNLAPIPMATEVTDSMATEVTEEGTDILESWDLDMTDHQSPLETQEEDLNSEDLDVVEKDAQFYPLTWCFVCSKDHKTRQPSLVVTERIRLASIFVFPYLRTTIGRLFDTQSMGMLDDRNTM